MKKKLLLFFYFIASQASIAQLPQKKVLFVGNSMTFFNEMPTIFQNIAINKGKNVVAQMYAPGGVGFGSHVNDANVYNLFKNNVWDVVILQPGTSESGGVGNTVSTTTARGNRLKDSIKKYSPCAKIMLYEISNGIAAANLYNQYFLTQKQIKDSITKMADGMQIGFVPAGESARKHYTTTQDLLLHNSFGDVHPNINGSYLVAASMFAAIFQESVSGTTFYSGVAPATAQYLQSIADDVVLNNKPLWRINTYHLNANFSFLENLGTINFTNQSSNFDSLLWNFGDGTTTTATNPSKTFTTNGEKTITLTAIKNLCAESFSKTILINSLSTINLGSEQPYIYPNPAADLLNISRNKDFCFQIINNLGQIVYSEKLLKKEHQIDISNLSAGIYILIFDDYNRYKFIKTK